ncbi:MAG: methylenetetrahydrofolate--tRNA-(uracil(54)-C(5))-methyltransferase (FADH(2)-oxidizing) TrmFO [Oscillospiraceae bacterium]|nr:methylenetetrahydrofolate--tRNA-(uracil(54)-C(5))-methyltransferase (FADH(2)-oxidizing) TrmFO [Oscillospiraceae bacterium]
MNDTVTVIGGGFAGVEAAKQLTKRGIRVRLYEMKPVKFSPAHRSEKLCEVVCSNSFKSANPASAAGLLKNEMAMLGSVCIRCANETAVPAGGALAVDRDAFSDAVTREIEKDPLIDVVREEVTHIPDSGVVIVAAGPLASDALSEDIKRLCGGGLSFFDAAAPIITAESVDMSHAFTASRYDKGGGDDYINCPMNKAEYEAFYEALTGAESVVLHDFEKKNGVYEGCMPIEIMAKRGDNTIRFGPMKPVGLVDPLTGHRPWAVLQLRKENAAGTLLNLVGFQTNLKFPEQKRVFGLIPALKNAEYVRYGVMHRNSFIDAPRVLTERFNLKNEPRIFFAGQITGVEGYMESASSGITAGINAARLIKGEKEFVPPADTMLGAFCRYVSDSSVKDYQPMGAAIGLLPPPEQRIRDKRERYGFIADRALKSLGEYIKENEKEV